MSKSELGLGEKNSNFKPSGEGRGAEERALAAVCNFVNDPYTKGEAEAPTRQSVTAAPIPSAVPNPLLAPPPAAPSPEAALPPEDLTKVIYTGKLGVGKDYLANLTGAKIFGFAEPLYALVETFFGVKVSATEGKELPGVRALLQTIGQWGRGELTEQYPLTAARASLSIAIRSGLIPLPENLGVKWETFGLNKNIWTDAALFRIDEYLAGNPGARVAITGCRFPNEYSIFQEAGFVHFHCVCSPNTWAARLAKRGLKPDAPALKDLSEKMAHELDANVMQQLSRNKVGKKLHCCWNDPNIPAPSSRLLTVAEFTKLFESAPVVAVNTGE